MIPVALANVDVALMIVGAIVVLALIVDPLSRELAAFFLHRLFGPIMRQGPDGVPPDLDLDGLEAGLREREQGWLELHQAEVSERRERAEAAAARAKARRVA